MIGRFNLLFVALLSFVLVLSVGGHALAAPILGPGDSVIAIDIDPPNSDSSYPGGEPPSNTVDGTLAKYLNFGGPGSGFIVTPAAGSTTIQTFQLTTANDAEGRDPTSFLLWGTNDAIVSADNSDGMGGENWTMIDGFDLDGGFALPAARDTVGPVIPVFNSTAYTSYKMQFPTNKGDGLFQIAEASFFESNDGSGADVLNPGDPVLAFQLGPDSGFPGAEGPGNLIDDDPGTKYLNFGRENAGFIVTPTSGPSRARSFQITTANDADSRDPTSWELYGTDDPVVSDQNSRGDGENWTLIDSGMVDLPLDRVTDGPIVPVSNDAFYASYRMIFPTIRDPDAGNADSIQIAGIQFFSTVPEPSSVILAALGLFAVCGSLRSRRS